MSFEPEDYADLVKQRRALLDVKRAHGRPSGVTARKQAAVAMERLTGQPEWDYFLSLVEARRQELAQAMDASSDVLLSDQTDPDRALRARFRFLAAREARDQLDWAIGLPAEIRASARLDAEAQALSDE